VRIACINWSRIVNHSEIVLHTGMRLPRRLIDTVAAWDQTELTPGWLDALSDMVAEVCARWRIALDPVIPASYVTLVLLGHSPTLGPVAVKSSPLADEFRSEATALEMAKGDRVARLYEVDFSRSVMVIEQIVPGIQLRDAELSDDDATRIAAEAAVAFWRPVPDPAGLHPLRRWMRALLDESPSDRVPPDLVAQARELGMALLASSPRTFLLHGDLQHHNLLQRADGAWIIIDPKGVVGDPGYEIAAWMANPFGVTARADYRAIAARRAAIYAAVTGLERQEVLAWAFVGLVLNACWSAEDPVPDGWLSAVLRGAREVRALLG
jgi:streptomycin 6-kinase